MQSHVIAGYRWISAHRYQLALITALSALVALLVLASPLLLAVGAMEWKRGKKRQRIIGLLLIALLIRTARWLWCELRGVPHAPWHPCAQCGRPIEEPSRASYCSQACRAYTRLERDAQANDPRIAERAERRLRNLRYRDAADSDPRFGEVPF